MLCMVYAQTGCKVKEEYMIQNMKALEIAQKHGKTVMIKTPISPGKRAAWFHKGKYCTIGSVRQGALVLNADQISDVSYDRLGK